MPLFLFPTGTVIYTCFVALLAGGFAGSALNCYAYRREKGESWVKGRSRCDICGHTLNIIDLLPVLGYIIRKGRCAYCGAKFDSGHLWAEITSSLVFLSAVLKFGISIRTAEYILLAIILLGVSFCDLHGYIIPDGFIIAGFVIRIIFLFIEGFSWSAALDITIGAVSVALVLIVCVIIAEKVMKKDAMGGGDIKLLALTGAFLGWKLNIVCLLVACVIGIIIGTALLKKRGESRAFPWGPSIAASAWLTLLFGQGLLSWYLSLF